MSIQPTSNLCLHQLSRLNFSSTIAIMSDITSLSDIAYIVIKEHKIGKFSLKMYLE